MKRRRIAIGLASVVVAGGVAVTVTASLSPRVIPVQATIHLANNPGQVFAPPPANAAPNATIKQLWFTRRSIYKIPINTTVLLGLYTRPVGTAKDCGHFCSKDPTLTLHDGIYYRSYQQLAYGISGNVCPAGGNQAAGQCTEWTFFNANTGKFIEGIVPRPGNHSLGSVSLRLDPRSADPAAASSGSHQRWFNAGGPLPRIHTWRAGDSPTPADPNKPRTWLNLPKRSSKQLARRGAARPVGRRRDSSEVLAGVRIKEQPLLALPVRQH